MHCRSVQGTMQAPLFSAAVQNRFTAGLCHCNHTCGDLLFIQLCSDSAAMLCSTAQGKMHSPLFSAALQNKLTAGLCHCNHTYGDLLFIQVCRDPAPMLCNTAQGKMHSPMFSRLCKTGSQQACVTAIAPMEIWLSYRCAVTQHQCTSGQNASPTVQCCSAKQAHSRHCVTALTPMKIWSSYRCAGTQHQCTAALFRGQCKPHCSVLLCNIGSQQAACHCTYTYEDLLFTQVCSVPAPLHCSTVQGTMKSPLFSAALQNKLTAGSMSLHLHLWRFAVYTAVQ